MKTIAMVFFLASPVLYAKTPAKLLKMGGEEVAHVKVHGGGSVLSFPVKPSKVIMGRDKEFDIEYVENDVAVVPLSSSAKANMFIYLLGKRYAFTLEAGGVQGDKVILIRDEGELDAEVEVQ